MVNLNQFISKLIIRLEDELETDTLKYILETENTYVLAVTPVETRNIFKDIFKSLVHHVPVAVSVSERWKLVSFDSLK